MYNLILKHIGEVTMRKIHLFIASVSLVLLSCGSSDTTTANDNKSYIEYPTTGSGTFESPYSISNGIYPFIGEKYYSVEVIKNECNVLVYGVKNFDAYNNLQFIDDSHSREMTPTYNYLYENLNKNGYDVIVDSDNYASFGIFSPCIEDSKAQSNAYVELEAGDRVTMSANNALYKFTTSRIGNFVLNTTGTEVEARLYDHKMLNIYSELDSKHEKVLQSGEYYLLVSKSTKTDIQFVFDFLTMQPTAVTSALAEF